MIKAFPNILPTELLQKCFEYSEWIIKGKGEGRTMFSSLSWGPNVIGDGPPVLIHLIPEQHEIVMTLAGLCEQLFEQKPNNVQFTYWPVNSYIPWHNDGSHKGALTIYINQQWKRDWGGLFMYDRGNDIRVIVPQPNFGVYVTPGTWHATTPVYPSGRLRRTIQIWF